MNGKQIVDEHRKPTRIILVMIAVLFYFTSTIFAIMQKRVLYADGSNFLLNVINNSNQLVPRCCDGFRIFSNMYNEALVSIAIKMGGAKCGPSYLSIWFTNIHKTVAFFDNYVFLFAKGRFVSYYFPGTDMVVIC